MKINNLIVLTALLLTATAQGFTGGDGSAVNPYQISTREHLEAVNDNLSANYILMNDIVLGGITYDMAVISPVLTSNSPRFTGTFNGNGFEIKNLTINGGSNSYIGLFGRIRSSASVYNLGITDCDISGKSSIGGLCGYNDGGTITSSYATGEFAGSDNLVGALCGYNLSNGTITSSYTIGTVLGSSSVGGLCGRNDGTIDNSFATGQVSGASGRVGGLCGENLGAISSSYATGAVSGKWYVGGLCGDNTYGTISSSYATGSVSGDFKIGGLCGVNLWGRTIRCYSVGKVSGTSDIGGLVGYVDTGGNYEDTGNFWDMETSEFVTSVMGNGKTTVQMQDINTFLVAGWDFDDVWIMSGLQSEFEGYPVLLWQTENMSFTVIFDLDGKGTRTGGGELTQTVAYGDAAVAPEVAVETGWIFIGWDVAFNNVTSDLTITALYEAWDGDGSAVNPYQISTREHLEAVNNDLSANYILMNDIDLSGITYDRAVIAPYFDSNSLRFTGTFNGNGFAIKNLTIDGGSNGYIGFFGITDTAIIKNFGIVDCDISGSFRTGGLIGKSYDSTINNSFVVGNVGGTGDNIGGLLGRSRRSTITNSYAAGSLNGTVYVGGLVGGNVYSTITNSRATVSVTGSERVGGLVGENWYSLITNSYAAGSVNGSRYVGGLCGWNWEGEIIRCYSVGKVAGTSDVGGLVGIKITGENYEDTGNFGSSA